MIRINGKENLNGGLSGTGAEFPLRQSDISGTSDVAPNIQTGIDSVDELVSKIREHENRINILEQVDQDKVRIEKLYGPDSKILKARDIMRTIKEYLTEAISNEDELVIGNQIDLIWSSLLELQFYMINNPISTNLEEGITMVQTALYNHRTMPLKREKIVALNNVFDRFRNNIQLSEDELDFCLDKLEETGFDISSPMTGLDDIYGTE